MFVDELTIYAKAGNGGDGVERWLRTKYKPKGGPAGGNGGNGGDVYLRAVRNINQLSKYTGEKLFAAESGVHGQGNSKYGRNGADLIIDVPVGSHVTVAETGEQYDLREVGQTVRVLHGGRGGLGNEHFKSATNRTPIETTAGTPGERSDIHIELSLVVDVGIIGLPNAGKSTLLNALTNAKSRIGAYPFTTLEPHLGDLHGFILADIPGLISGASKGKGLGHKFLRHIARTRMLLHCISLEDVDPMESYRSVRVELNQYNEELGKRTEWVLLTKADCVEEEVADAVRTRFEREGYIHKNNLFVVSRADAQALKELADALCQELAAGTEGA